MHPSWNNSASGSWLRAAYWRLTMPTSPRLALMNRCRACSPWSSRARSSCSVASAKPAPEALASRASRPASIARCSSTVSARVSGPLASTSSICCVMPDTVRQALPVATPSCSKSVDNWISRRRRCCGCVAPCAAPPAPPVRRTSGCICAAPRPGSYAAAWISVPRSSASP